MENIIIETEFGPLSPSNEKISKFLQEYADKTLKEVFKLDESDTWLKDISFHELELSIRAHHTMAQSFPERDYDKQTLDFVTTEYTPARIITRRNAGYIVFKEFMYVLSKVISEKDAASGKQRNLSFDPEIFKAE